MGRKKVDLKNISKTFDVTITNDSSTESESSDYIDTAKISKNEEVLSFDQKVQDIQGILEPDIVSEKDENDLIIKAIEEAQETGDIEADVEADIAMAVAKEVSDIPFEGPYVDSSPPPVEVKKESVTEPSIAVPKQETCESDVEKDGLFLDLIGHDLEIYKQIRAKCPQFTITCNSLAFKDFYQYKFKCLKDVLVDYPILDVKDLESEITAVKTDHAIGSDVISLEFIRRRLDSCLQHRTRLNSVLLEILCQSSIWKRKRELMCGRLWKDHQIKGAEKRDGLVSEHMNDVDDYVTRLEALIVIAERQDNAIKFAFDCISRQLSCLQVRDPSGFKTDEPMVFATKPMFKTGQSEKQEHHEIDGLDVLEVNAPKSSGRVSLFDFGGVEDDLSQLGIS